MDRNSVLHRGQPVFVNISKTVPVLRDDGRYTMTVEPIRSIPGVVVDPVVTDRPAIIRGQYVTIKDAVMVVAYNENVKTALRGVQSYWTQRPQAIVYIEPRTQLFPGIDGAKDGDVETLIQNLQERVRVSKDALSTPFPKSTAKEMTALYGHLPPIRNKKLVTA